MRMVYEYDSGREAAFDIHTSWVTPDNFPGYVEQEVQFRFDNGLWNGHSRKRGVECTVEGHTPFDMKISMNNHYNGSFLEPWGERSQRGYGVEVIERFVREVAFLEYGGEDENRGDRLEALRLLKYNDLSADRQVVAAVQALEAILERASDGEPDCIARSTTNRAGWCSIAPESPRRRCCMRAASEVDREVEAAHAGQSVYSPGVLRMYDWFVLGLSNRFIWRCPTRHLEQLYREHLTANHLDVGVGTGYFLDHCEFLDPSPRVALMDLNENCLSTAAARIARYNPEQLRRNILEPIAFDGEPFDSIGINYVLHCLPGTIEKKSIVFDHLRPLLNPGGVLFGSTLLAEGVPRNAVARRLAATYNRQGIFGNAADSLEGLQSALDARFATWQVDTMGCAALFWGR